MLMGYSNDLRNRYLKESTTHTYTVAEINAYPTTTYAVQIVTTIIYACMLHPQVFPSFYPSLPSNSICGMAEFSQKLGASDTVLNGRRWPPIIFGAVSLPTFLAGYSELVLP
jgi:MFS transporter, ACS family, pantothenate transporter